MEDGFDPSPADLELHVEGFEGPLYLLLDLARRQRGDMAEVSILVLVDQYVAAISESGRDDELKAVDWLVMAAWLSWLKSRLLLPKEMAEAKEAERAAAVLFNRLAELEKVRAGAVWLEERPQLGRDFFRKGRRDPLPDPAPVGGYVALMEACLAVLRPRHNPETDTFVIKPRRSITTPTEAFSRMRAMLGDLPEGAELLTFLPKLTADLQDIKFELRSAISSSLVASLELARIGQAGLEQEIPFGLLIIRPLNSAP